MTSTCRVRRFEEVEQSTQRIGTMAYASREHVLTLRTSHEDTRGLDTCGVACATAPGSQSRDKNLGVP